MSKLEEIVEKQLLSLINVVEPSDIDLWEIADQLNIRITPSPVVSFLYEDTITLDERIKYEDQRVALAHELCHAVLHSGNQLSLVSSFLEDQERQAVRMSHYLLCPTTMIETVLNGEVFRSQSEIAPFIADTFFVPLSFAKKRLQMFDLDHRVACTPQLGRDYDTVWEHPGTGRRIYFKNGELVRGVVFQ